MRANLASMSKIGNRITIGVGAVVIAGLAFGGYSMFHGEGQQHAQAVTFTAPVAESVAAPTQDMTAAQSIYDQQVAHAAAAAEAKAAADAAAAKLAADKTAKQVATTTPSATNNPKGTPLPMVRESDPNNAQYGQMVIGQDPGTFCAAHTGSTINGVPVCD